MSKYYFHIIDGKADVDVLGVELSGLDAMRREAVKAAGEMLAGGDQTWNGDAWQMIVTDEDTSIVYGVRFSVDRYGL